MKWAIQVLLAAALSTGSATTVIAQAQPKTPLDNLHACLLASRPATSESDFFNSLNPAITDPDRVSWCLFLYVASDAATQGNNDALFETWASDGQTFVMQPVWPAPGQGKQLRPNILLQVLEAERPLALGQERRSIQPFLLPPPKPLKDNDNLEETRRNKAAFDFIVNNNLQKVSGLKNFFASHLVDHKPLTFPADAIEVKANWFPVQRPSDPSKSGIPGYTGSPADAGRVYHVNTTSDGKQYALVAMHVISKIVPNWTWATFEHQNNPGRCEYIGCRDSFGTISTYIPPDTTIPDGADPSYQNPKNNPAPYPPCTRSDALKQLFSGAKIDPAFQFYCMKGSQTDFVDATGMPVRVGNSITEETFDFQASCMTCHSRAAFLSNGTPPTGAGFDRSTGAPLGPVHGEWFWSTGIGGPWFPAALPGNTIQPVAVAASADFVWSIPFCAIADSENPVPQTRCAAK